MENKEQMEDKEIFVTLKEARKVLGVKTNRAVKSKIEKGMVVSNGLTGKELKVWKPSLYPNYKGDTGVKTPKLHQELAELETEYKMLEQKRRIDALKANMTVAQLDEWEKNLTIKDTTLTEREEQIEILIQDGVKAEREALDKREQAINSLEEEVQESIDLIIHRAKQEYIKSVKNIFNQAKVFTDKITEYDEQTKHIIDRIKRIEHFKELHEDVDIPVVEVEEVETTMGKIKELVGKLLYVLCEYDLAPLVEKTMNSISDAVEYIKHGDNKQ